MHATGDLTGCEQTGDGGTVLGQNLGGGVNLQAAHGVVDTGGNLDGVVRSSVQGVGKAGTTELRVVLCFHIAVPGVHGLGESSLIHAQSLCQLLVGLTLRGEALLDVALDDVGSISHGLVNNQVAVAAGLSNLSSGNLVAGADFVEEALALGIDQDGTVATQAFGNQSSGVGFHGGVNLNLIHVHGSSAQSLSHLDALTLNTGSIGGHEASQLGLVGNNHVQVGAEAAGGQDDSVSIDGQLGAIVCHAGHAAGSAVGIGEDGINSGVQDDFHTGILEVLLQNGHDVSAHGQGLALGVDGSVDSLDGSAAECANAGQRSAHGIQPNDGISGVAAQGLDQLGVVDTLAANHGVQLHQLNRVEVAFGICLVGFPLLTDSGSQSGDGLVVGVALGSSQGLLHTGGLTKGVLVLQGGLGSVHAAGCTDGVAAHHGLALHHNDLQAVSSSGDGSGHASAAGTNHDHVRIHGAVFTGSSSNGGLVVLGVQASLGQSSLSSCHEGIGGNGCAGNGIHSDGAGFGNDGREGIDDLRADALGLLVAGGRAAHNLAVLQRQGDGHVAAQTLGSAGEVTGNAVSCHSQPHGQHHADTQQNRNKFLHVFSPFNLMGFPILGTNISQNSQKINKKTFLLLF